MSTTPSSGSDPDPSGSGEGSGPGPAPDDRAAPDDQPPLLVRQAVEGVTYALVVVAIAGLLGTVVGTLISVSLGCGLFRGLVLAKQILFFVGFGVLAYAAIATRPRSPFRKSREERSGILASDGNDGGEEGDGAESDGDGPGSDPSLAPAEAARETTAFQRVVARVPPMRFVSLAPEERIGGGTRVVVAGFAILALTIVMELAGVTVVNVTC